MGSLARNPTADLIPDGTKANKIENTARATLVSDVAMSDAGGIALMIARGGNRADHLLQRERRAADRGRHRS